MRTQKHPTRPARFRTAPILCSIAAVLLLSSCTGARLASGPPKPTSDLPEHLEWALAHPTERPPAALLVLATPADKPWLLKRFRDVTRPSDRVSVTWLLAYIGDDEVYRAFSWMLRHGHGNSVLRPNERTGYWALLQGMGVMAQTNNAAFRILEAAVDPDWWRRERKWQLRGDQPSMNPALAGVAIRSLGLSARKEAAGLLDRLKTENRRYVCPEDRREVWTFESRIYEAHLFLAISRQMGLAEFRANLFEEKWRPYALSWLKSKEGFDLLEWCYPKSTHPSPWNGLDQFLAEIVEWW